MTAEFYRFVLASGFAAIVNIVSREILSIVLSFKVSVILAYFLGMTTAFFLNQKLVFQKSQRHVGHKALRFAIVNLIALAQVWFVSVGLAQFLFPMIKFTWHAEIVAHIIGVASPIGTSYLGHKKFTFG